MTEAEWLNEAGHSPGMMYVLQERNLDQLPRPHGFHVSCLPVKIQGASAGWCRAVALVPEE